MPEEKRCPECGAVLPMDTPQGLCPACLLKRGLATGSSVSASDQGKRTEYVPPTPDELARYFPELEIVELIGRGGMGAVYKARQKRLDRLVALKVLPFSVSRDPAFAERFIREAKALARLTHPHIVTVHDFGQKDGLFYFVMEFVDGLNLRQLLDAAKISPREALAIVPQICDALQYAHDKGIVHRDIKPENILLAKDGTVKIADFGLAKLVGLEAKDLTITGKGDVMGTPHYMAPEQVEHPQDVDHRADIYSLGVVFYQMLTGELPLGKFAPPSRKVQIDVRLDEVVLRALEKEPEHRYQHASDVKTQVETIAQTEGQKIESRRSRIEAHLCGTAIAGACLIPLFLGSAFFWDFGHLGGLRALVGVVVSSLGFVAILGTTILGWVAVSQIRRSEGRLYGMWLALTDGLLGPILLLDILILLGLLLTNKLINVGILAKWYPDLQEHAFLNVPHSLIWLLIATAAVTAVDYALIRRVWRVVNKPIAAPVPPVQKPDRFWRWLAVTVVALIASPFVIGALLVILTPLFLMFFEGRERAQRVNQQNAQHAAAMPQQQVLAEFNWSKLAAEGRILGGVPVTVDGRTALKIENTNNAPLQLTLFKIENPPITCRTYAVSGEIKYENVEGDGYLEMWNDFAAAGRFFSRTLGPAVSDPTGKITGTSGWRTLLLPFNRTGTTNAPTRLEINIFLPGRGVVFLGPMKLVQPVEPTDAGVRPTASVPAFGPVTERVLDNALALDSGRTGISPLPVFGVANGGKDRLLENIVTIEQAGWDVIQDTPDTVLVLGMKVLPLTAAQWDTWSPQQTVKEIGRTAVQVFVQFRPEAIGLAGIPATYAVQTREGVIGLVQITGFTANPRHARIRYKLVRNSTDSSTSTTVSPVARQTAELEFRLVAAEGDTHTPADELADPNDRTGQTKLRVLKEVLLDSSAIAGANLGVNQYPSDAKVMSITLNNDAVAKFADITAVNIGHKMAIVWRGRVLSAPVIRAKIAGPAVEVTGKLSDAEWQVLLDLLNFKPAPSTTNQTTKRAEVSPAALAEPPVLRFLAWQDEWKTDQPGAARHPDGSPVTDATELSWLRQVHPCGMDVSQRHLSPEPRFLHLWFSHPLFGQTSLNEVTLLDDTAKPIPLGADGSMARMARGASEPNGDLGWLTDTLSPGEGTNILARVTVRLRYTIGPLERTREVAVSPNTRVLMSLEGDSGLNGVGQNADGKAFVSIAVAAGNMTSRKFGAVAVTKDGRELTASGGESGRSDGLGVRVESFEFDEPLANVAKFIIGTRPIRTMEWKDVVLSEN
ncbi:MAG TPA: protein kinase [Verrucomicrobiae bacterium]|nr:protein kinase [Verrucomicrobiae bacterium]